MIFSQSSNTAESTIRCGIVLSAGNGTRLQEFVRQRRGDDLPKQYVNFVGRRSMLEHTWDRAESLIPAERLFIVVAKEHLRFSEVHCQLALTPPQSLVVQPANKETAPGILLPLLHVYKRYPDAIVALFPSDHFVLEEERFMQYVDRAFLAVESDPSRLVLLGMEPDAPDSEYGYIVPGKKLDALQVESVRQVEMFVEKPSTKVAAKIIDRGALWNTMVMVFSCKTLLSVIRRAAPEISRAFEPIQNALGTADERQVIEQVYRKLPPLNFSTGILEALPFEHRQALLVLPVRGVTWSDWGTMERLSTMLDRLGADGVRQESGVSDPGRLRVA
ncbi:MAG: sugar phosphate nucleotidyltransferase [Chloroflexota bacterium]